MAKYIPTDWKDEIVDGAGNIVQTGTPLSAANLKKLEAGVEGAVAAVDGKVEGADFSKFKTDTTTALADTAKKTDVQNELKLKRDKTIPIGLNDADVELLAAISGGEGTSFNLLSEPRNYSVSPLKTTFLIQGKNLHNKNTNIESHLISNTTGVITPNAFRDTTEFIDISSNGTWAVSHKRSIAFFDKNKIFISGIGDNENGTQDQPYTFTKPSNAHYMRMSVSKSFAELLQVEAGDKSTDYEEYHSRLSSDVKFSQSNVNYLYDEAKRRTTQEKMEEDYILSTQFNLLGDVRFGVIPDNTNLIYMSNTSNVSVDVKGNNSDIIPKSKLPKMLEMKINSDATSDSDYIGIYNRSAKTEKYYATAWFKLSELLSINEVAPFRPYAIFYNSGGQSLGGGASATFTNLELKTIGIKKSISYAPGKIEVEIVNIIDDWVFISTSVEVTDVNAKRLNLYFARFTNLPADFNTSLDILNLSFTTSKIGDSFRVLFKDLEQFEKVNSVDDVPVNVLDLSNVDRISFIGDSNVASHYTLAGKHFIQRVSELTDYNMENFSMSGKDYVELINYIRDGLPLYHSTLSYKDFNSTYAFLMSNSNDDEYRTDNIQMYYDNLQKLIDVVKALGARPIVSTRYEKVDFGKDVREIKGNKEIADRNNALFYDATTKSQNLSTGVYQPFFGGGHMGTRTNFLTSDTLLKFVKQLPRPNSSLKVFRKRSHVAVSDIKDLIYNNNEQRAEKFKEIFTGHHALNEETQGYFDALDQNFAFTRYDSEYLKLLNKDAISLTKYSLAELIFNGTSNTIDEVTIHLSNTNVRIYVKDVFNKVIAKGKDDPLYNNQLYKPIAQWVEVNGKNGAFTLSKKQLKRSLEYDKLSVLMVADTDFALSDIYATWKGVGGKEVTVFEKFEEAKGKKLFTSFFNNQSDISDWIAVGNVNPIAAIDSVGYPIGVSSHILLDGSNSIQKSYNFEEEQEFVREVEIKVWARYNPKIFAPNGDLSTNAINKESFDYAKLRISVVETGSTQEETVKYNRLVGLYWSEIAIRVPVVIGATSQDLKIEAIDKSLEISRVSARMI